MSQSVANADRRKGDNDYHDDPAPHLGVSIGQSASTGKLRPCRPLAAYPGMMQRARKREGFRVCRAAWSVGVSVRDYREIEARRPRTEPGYI